MKGMSVVLTVLLFVLAAELANVLKQAGVLPAEETASDEILTADRAFTNGPERFVRYENRGASPSQFNE